MNGKKIFVIGAIALMFLMTFSSVVVATETGSIKKETPFPDRPYITDQGTVYERPYLIDYRFYSDNTIILNVWCHVADIPPIYHYVGTFYFDGASCSNGMFYLEIVMNYLHPTDIDIGISN